MALLIKSAYSSCQVTLKMNAANIHQSGSINCLCLFFMCNGTMHIAEQMHTVRVVNKRQKTATN